jgi:hypothetical protein
MAKRKVGRGRYRMTPKRRAALKKAQMVSARKRRRGRVKNGLKAAAVIGVAVGSHAATHWTNYAIQHPVQTYKGAKKAGQWAKSKTSRRKTVKVTNISAPAAIHRAPSNWKRAPGGGYLYNG